MELQGTVKKIGETQTFASGFQKRELVLETDEQYKLSWLGREWTNPQGEVKYFNSISGWRLEKVSGENKNTEAPQPNTFQTPAPATNENPFADEGDEDLPF